MKTKIFDPQARNDKYLERERTNFGFRYNKFSPGIRDSQMLILAHNSTGEQKEKFKGRLGIPCFSSLSPPPPKKEKTGLNRVNQN